MDKEIDRIIQKEYDVIVVGAGPSGTSATHYLAEKGFSTLLVDKATFPRDKVCAGGFTLGTLPFLHEMGVYDEFKNADIYKADSLVVSSPSLRKIKGQNPYYKSFGNRAFIMKRTISDQILFNKVKNKPGVETIEGFKIIDVIRDNNRICGVKGKYRNTVYEVHGKYIICASGAHSILGKKLGLKNIDPDHNAFAVRAFYKNVDVEPSSIEIHYEKSILPGYGWIFPVGEGLVNIGCGVHYRFQSAKDINALFEKFITNNKYVREKMKNAEMVGSLAGFPITALTYTGKRSQNNVLLVGDSGSFVDGITGFGLPNALSSGKLAAAAISRNRKSPDHVGEIFEKMWKKVFLVKDIIPKKCLLPLLGHRGVIEYMLYRADNNQKKADILAGAVNQAYNKWELVKCC